MIKVLIIEDEIPARKKLKRFLQEVEESIVIIAELDTVQSSVKFLKENNVDLIISDIELLDGNAFEIYRQVKITSPIIFSTAYDQFLMKAFETNGIEYLLKPFSKERFNQAWGKFLILRESKTTDDQLLSKIHHILEKKLETKTYKNRFSINSPKGVYFLEAENITFFEANEGVIFAYEKSGKKHLLSETTLKGLEVLLHPVNFFRINRNQIVNKKYIEKMERYTKNTLAIKISHHQAYLKTSQSITANFREWIEK
ncbi:MAG: LytTR family DNA-binding domain-containing protein [Cellulophaga sp.]|nr:LytTR family DNA-binding domain-containing protein [Cellulophaga sp.]